MSKKKIVQINVTCGYGSTGNICIEVSKLLTAKNIENYILYSSQSSNYDCGKRYTNDLYIKLQAIMSRIRGNYGFNSKRATKKLISELKDINPDIIHLHNLHGHNCNIEQLFEYFSENEKKVYWTFHDCWAFTGYCPHYTMVNCDKWKNECESCPQYKHYSWFLDRSNYLYKKKQKAISDMDLTIITPSEWLGGQVRESFLSHYPVKVINNGIDLGVFHHIDSNFKERNQINEEKKIVLGVANQWGERKGLDVFLELSNRLDDQEYQIVLVGTDEKIERILPYNIKTIRRTTSKEELAEIYSVAAVFVNPTKEDTFPTVNIEALACGTPVITYNVGGSPEIIDSTCGKVVDVDDMEELEKQIKWVCEEHPFTIADCVERARKYNVNDRYKEYVEQYEV